MKRQRRKPVDRPVGAASDSHLTASIAAEPLAAALAEPLEVRYRIREGHLLEVDDVTSTRMANVRQRGTRPELVVRRAVHSLGHRYRLDNRDLEGNPDLANRIQRWAIFVHGCFWHRHGCKASSTPSRNREFWQAKFARNIERDRHAIATLQALGYRVVVIWECQTKAGEDAVRVELERSLGVAPRAREPARTLERPTRPGRT
jgi:DNA mismatch endonuclease (patch repair protein)